MKGIDLSGFTEKDEHAKGRQAAWEAWPRTLIAWEDFTDDVDGIHRESGDDIHVATAKDYLTLK